MASGAAPDGAPALDEAAKSSSSAGAGEPPAASAPEPEDRVARNLDISWTEERYAAAQAEREAIREGALSERRKLNVEERMEYWAVESRLLDEIGPEAYDQFHYDNGRKNRTKVHWVASNSHAGQAGIEGGDILISYGGEPVFGPRSAREINRLVPPGEEIIVQVERNGQVLEFLLSSDMRNRRRSGIVNGMTLLPMAVEP